MDDWWAGEGSKDGKCSSGIGTGGIQGRVKGEVERGVEGCGGEEDKRGKEGWRRFEGQGEKGRNA